MLEKAHTRDMKNTYCVLDTETCDLTGSVYDVGYVICDRYGNTIREYNALTREVFTDAKRMMGAFYAGRIFTHYADMLQTGAIRLVPWQEIIARLNSDIFDFNVNIICAYNAGFDFRVMKATHEMLGFSGYVLDQPAKMLDLWQLACETKLRQTDYIRMALENGWTSPQGNIRTGAEYAFRYITRNAEFAEDHTALSDARIEAAILAECLRQKKRIPYGIVNSSPWRIVAEKAEQYRERMT